MAGTELFATNRPSTTVSSGGTDAPAAGTSETWTVASSAAFGPASTGVSQFHVADPAAPSEVIAVTNVSSTTWTVVRGAENTSPVEHVSGFTVYQVVTASYLSNAEDWFNVKSSAYGATGNGNTDDTTAIAAAISAAQAAGGGTVYFPRGVYKVTSSLLVGGGSPGALILRGSGWDSEIKLGTDANCYIFDTGSSGSPVYTPGLLVCDLYLNANGANQTGDSGCIYARGSCFGVFDHVWFDQPYNYGIHFYQDGLGNYGHHNRIFGCLFTNGYASPSGALGIGLKFDHADENSVIGCTFQDNGTGTSPNCQVYDTSAGRQTFSGCSFVTTHTTSAAMIKTDSSPSGVSISGCQFDSATTGNLLEINGPDCAVVGNQFLSFGTAANDAVHVSSTNTQITGNGFTPTGSSGYAIKETGSANYTLIGPNAYAGSYASSTPVVLIGVNSANLTERTADWLNVVMAPFGADPSGTNDSTTAIQAAVTAASAAGGTVYFPAGTYKVSSPVTVTGADVVLRGAGSQSSVLKMTASFGTVDTDRGIIEYLSGPSVFSGCGLYDLGFDSTACTDTTVNGPNCVYQNGSVPVRYFTAQRLYFNMNSYGQGILLNQVAGSGSQGYRLTFRDITGINGAGTISVYNNGVSSGSLMADILIDGVYNRCTQSNLNDDRVAISGNNGGGTDVTEVRNVSISNVFTECVSGAAGVVHGVKLDCGSYGYIHEVSVRNVFFYGLTSGVTGQNPVLCELGTSGTMQDILIDGVWAYNSGAVIAKLWRSDAAPHITIRNVHLYNLLDVRAIEVYTANAPQGDETILIENCTLDSGTSVSSNTPVGVMLTSGSSSQGASGLVTLRGITLAGTFSTGLSDTLNESGSPQATAYGNITIDECRLNAATTPLAITAGHLAVTEFNVCWFGADPTGTADSTAAIQAALNAIPSGGGGIYLPAGTYKVSSSLEIPYTPASVIMRGAGRGSTVINAASGFTTATPIVWVTASGSGYRLNPVLEDFTINTAATGLFGIQLDSTYFADVRRVNVEGVYAYSIYLNGSNTYYGAYTNVENCHIGAVSGGSGSGGTGITSNYHEHWNVTNCTIDWFNVSGGIGVQITNSDCFISGTHFDASDTGIDLYFCAQANVHSNSFDRGYTQFIKMQGNTGCQIVNNSFNGFSGSGNQYMIVPTSDGGRAGNLIAGNQAVASSGWYGWVNEGGGSGSQTDPDVYRDNNLNSGMAVNRVYSIWRNNTNYNPGGHGITQPGVPASGTVLTNTTGFDAMVYVTGGTVTTIALGTASTGATSGWIRVPALQTVTLTYTGSPSWSWFGD